MANPKSKPKPAEEYAAELNEKRRDPRLYKAQSDEHKGQMLSSDIQNKMAILQKVFARGKIDLYATEEVRAAIMEYLEACRLSGTYPSMEGLASYCGVSRQWMYQFIKEKPGHETTQLLSVYQTMVSDILQNQSLYRNCDAVSMIFLTKNMVGLGFKDKIEHEVAVEPSPLGDKKSAAELEAMYSDYNEPGFYLDEELEGDDGLFLADE